MLRSEGEELPKPLSHKSLRDFVEKAISHDLVEESFHSAVERAYRQISMDDILFGLESDWSIEDIRWHEDHLRYAYLIKTVDLDDHELYLVVSPLSEKRILKVVTKWLG